MPTNLRPRDTVFTTDLSPPSSAVLEFSFWFSVFHLRTMVDVQLSLLEIDNNISQFQNLLLTIPRPHPLRSLCLLTLAIIRLTRYKVLDESEDLDKSISHSTEAILLPFDIPIELGFDIIETLFSLARALLLRSQKLKQPGDVNHAIKYFHHLQDQSLETSSVTHSDIKAHLVGALSIQVELESADPMGILGRWRPSSAISIAHVSLGQAIPDEAIECLRKARIRFSDLQEIRPTLVFSLYVRFNRAHSHDDYEEAMSIVDEMIADQKENVELPMQLAGSLAWSRFQFDSKPEHLAKAIFRSRTHLNAISFEDPSRRSVMQTLVDLENIRFEAFGVGSGLQEDNFKVVDDSHLAAPPQTAQLNLVEFPLTIPDKRDSRPHVEAITSILHITDQTNIEQAVEYIEYCRLCLKSPHSHSELTHLALGRLLNRLFHLTGNVDYLHESITVHRDLVELAGVLFKLHAMAVLLIGRLHSRFKLLKDRRDNDEIMEISAIATADTSTDVALRFRTSCLWTRAARLYKHPSTLDAYETAISLMEQSLAFAPTLETQHFGLVAIRDEYEKLPLDYASYLIQIGELKRAIETLERGRGLLWSEMRGLHTSIDKLRTVNLPLAKKFAAVNRDLEALTISGSPAIGMEGGQVSGREGMDPVGCLVVKQRKLVEERDMLISQIRAQPGFDTFLIPPSFDTLRSAAAGGPVILINHSQWRSDIIIHLHDSPPSLIPTSDDFYDRAEGLHVELLATRNGDLDSREYEDALRYVLEQLYDLVGRPVIQRLRELNVPEQSRVWWCPTSVFCSLPLHAMGPIRSDGPTKLYFSDLYIPSYTPTLSALIESRKPSTQPSNTPSMLLVVQPDALMPSSLQEMHIVRTVCPSVETLFRKKAIPISTLEGLKHHRFAHISCHGILEIGKPFDAFFKLYEGTRLTLLDIIQSRLPTAEFAFLSACHTAEITEESIANEGLHLAAAVQYSGFRSVVGTMWGMADIDGPVVAGSFYKSVFSDRWRGIPYHQRTAEGLRDAVRDLRRKRNMTLERWVNYVHYGA
ncbi:CHAT domain-containing protein [Russula compacta]|nr:CHAT domain-containing protein [Russula compacta]